MTKPVLNTLILATGIILGALHYKFKPSPTEREIAEYTEGMVSSTVWQGQIAPDFELKTVQAEHFQVSDQVGKKTIVLNFFATWCGPCRAEMPELNRYFNEHKSDSFLLVGIDSEETRDRVDEFLADLKVDFPVGIDAGAIGKQYGVSALPTTVVIGVDGKVQFYEVGALVNAEVAFDNLLRQNSELLKENRSISAADYRLQAQKQPSLPAPRGSTNTSTEEEYKFDPRGQRIVDRMDCPCGCEKKVKTCTCNTAKKIKTALVNEQFKQTSDDEIIRALNKRFCSGAM